MDRDWGEHSHHRSTGRLLTYIEKGALSLKDLTEGINKFISSLDKDSEGDLFQFNANVCCIYFSVHNKLSIVINHKMIYFYLVMPFITRQKIC